MDKLIISGPASMKGEVMISRAKNAYLPILAGIVLADAPVNLIDLPDLRDIKTMIKILENMGVKVERVGNITRFDASAITSASATYDLVKTMRASIFILGPLLARCKEAKVSLPGGCAIGSRPIDIHLGNLEKLGAEITLDAGYVEAKVKNLVGTKLVLSFPSVGATENLMMAAVRAVGTTIIENAALEPEILDLANFLNTLGFEITGAGTPTVKIVGKDRAIKTKETSYRAIGDRIEAATYLMGALATNSEITIRGINPSLLDAVIQVLREMGGNIEIGEDWMQTRKSGVLKGCKIETAPFPGFPTDAQAQLIALATGCQSTSIITENIFENRFMHVPELRRLGAQIELKGNSAIVEGKNVLKSAPVMCTDLRASAALVIAALTAHGKTEIQRVYHLDRGYEFLDKKLAQLGVEIDRIND